MQRYPQSLWVHEICHTKMLKREHSVLHSTNVFLCFAAKVEWNKFESQRLGIVLVRVDSTLHVFVIVRLVLSVWFAFC